MDNQHNSLKEIFKELELRHLKRIKDLLVSRKFKMLTDAYSGKTYSLESIISLNRRIAELREEVLA